MFDSWTFGRRLAVGFGLAGLVLVGIAVVAYRTTSILIENEDLVDHTHQVRKGFADLLSELKDTEAGVRGYVITGDERYLEPDEVALKDIKGTYDGLRTLTADHPQHQARLTALRPLIDAKLDVMKQTVDARKTQGFGAAAAIVQQNVSKTEMEKIRAIVGDADLDASELLRVRTEESTASARLAKTVILWGGLLGALAVAAIGWFITSSLRNQIGEAVGQVESSSAELQAAANQQASGAKEQATAMNEIDTTISELLATSRQIAESAQRVSETAEQTAGASRAGHGTVDLTDESISGIRGQVDQIVARMLELGNKSQQIGSVLDIVSELAEQTNILAINATIEAAGAGDAGKRFSVVADEIRKLADRVGGSTKEIRALIDDVRSAVNTTVMATEAGSKAVDTGSRQFADVASTFKKISDLVLTTTEAAREIELSTKQQATAVEQVKIAISNVTQASKETEASSGQTLQTASQLAILSKGLRRIVQPQEAI
jgi:methyl-accepting chemotaxis protein